MNWLTWLMRGLQLVPIVVAGIEQIHQDASGATKKQMALSALSLATGTAEILVPEQRPAIEAANALTSNLIDNVVATMNAAGVFQKRGQAKAAPVLVPAPLSLATVAAVADAVSAGVAETVAPARRAGE